MALGERIQACRQRAGMSQEKVAELVGVSRQAVTKWEANQSAPNTENLFKLAEIFGSTVDLLLSSEDQANPSPVEQAYRLYRLEEAKRVALQRQAQKRNLLAALWIALGYWGIYLVGRAIWCTPSQGSLMGWLLTAPPAGAHSYLYGWLLSSKMFWYAMAISVIPAGFGKHRFSCATLIGFVLGLVAGMIFGPYPEGAPMGQGHYGWAIWSAMELVSIVVGILLERARRRSASHPTA